MRQAENMPCPVLELASADTANDGLRFGLDLSLDA